MPPETETFRYPVYVFLSPFPRKLFPGASWLQGTAHNDAELIAMIREGVNVSLNGEVLLSTLPKPFSEYKKNMPKFKEVKPVSTPHGILK